MGKSQSKVKVLVRFNNGIIRSRNWSECYIRNIIIWNQTQARSIKTLFWIKPFVQFQHNFPGEHSANSLSTSTSVQFLTLSPIQTFIWKKFYYNSSTVFSTIKLLKIVEATEDMIWKIVLFNALFGFLT